MRIFKYFLAFTLVSGFLFQSCETTQLEDLVSPNALSPEDASADLLFNQAQLNFLGAMADMQYNGAALGRRARALRLGPQDRHRRMVGEGFEGVLLRWCSSQDLHSSVLYRECMLTWDPDLLMPPPALPRPDEGL